MFNSMCLDEYGKIIHHLTQWDKNQKLIVELEDFVLTTAPLVHFCNKKSEEALVIQSTLNSKKVVSDIPNCLLREPYNINAYIYLENGDSGKTIKAIEIPIRKRVQPNDYLYEDNVDVVYLSELIAKVNQLNSDMDAAEIQREKNVLDAIRKCEDAVSSVGGNFQLSTVNEVKSYLGI